MTLSPPSSLASVTGTLSISGPIVSVHAETNFPAFDPRLYVVELIVTTPESSSIPLPKCGGHEGACRLETNTIDDKIDCDGTCHPGEYTLTINVFSQGGTGRLDQGPGYLAWVGGEKGQKLHANPLALPDPQHADALYLHKVVSLTRTSY